MNPWKLIGWIVLGFMVLFMWYCARVAMRVAESEPQAYDGPRYGSIQPNKQAVSYSAKVIGFTCEGRYDYTTAKLTIRNTGSTQIPFAKLFVNFTGSGGSAQGDSYFSPSTIPPGATASADVMQRGDYNCEVQAVQDGHGNPVTTTE